METDIEKKITDMIRAGQITKRPRLYFALQLGLIIALSTITFLLSLFVLSFIIFSLHESGEQTLLGFGREGFLTFFALFPWLSLALVILLLIVLEWLLRNFRSGYRLPILRIFGALVLVAVAGSVLLSLTPLHPALLGLADRDSLPLIGSEYEQIHDPHQQQGVFRGDVTSIATSTFTCAHNDHDHDTDDGAWVVRPPQEFDLSSLHVGERVYVAGRPGPEGVIDAYGIHPF